LDGTSRRTKGDSIFLSLITTTILYSLTMPVGEETENEKRLSLSEDDTALLDIQVHIPPTDAGYKTIYRFADRVDVVVMLISSVAAAAAGTCLPLMTVGTQNLLFGPSFSNAYV
jgi:hypothetical protein